MDTRVLCCPVTPHPDAIEALNRYAPQAEIVDATGDNYAYWREISARWTGETDLILVEQDIEIGPGTIAAMADCDQDWCCFAYPIFRTKVRLRVGLGCTKISASAQRKVPAKLIAEGFQLCAACKGKGCWWHLDGRVAAMLKRNGFFPHVHGDVIHHHDYHVGAGDENGVPVEWFFEEDGDQSAALAVSPDLIEPFSPAVSRRQAIASANELLRIAETLAADPSQAVPLGEMAPFPLGVILPGQAYDTDKVMQGYLPAYHDISEQLGPSARVCEIGVLNGGSLATWQDMYPQGTVAGVDIDPAACWPEGTLRIVAGQDDPALPDLLSAHEPVWDLVVDDASHDGKLSAETFRLLWPLVSPGGFYVIEDWFVGFDDYAGPSGPYDSSMLDLAKSLLERLHWDTDTESVSYRYGMAIIRKRA